MSEFHSIDNKPLALITGASRGIGEAIARSFAQAGYNLVLTCNHSYNKLTDVSDRLVSKYHIECIPIQADMSDFSQVEKVFSSLERLDVLVNNAGISYVGLLHEMTPDQWHRVLAVNLDSCFYTSKCAIPLMLRRHAGRIINISSVWGKVGASMEAAYSASKGGMNALTKALAKELAPSNIQVNAIACGVIDTSMNACFTPEDLEVLRSEIPADRIGDPGEVAKLALQLANAPEYMTGQIITIDGGWY